LLIYMAGNSLCRLLRLTTLHRRLLLLLLQLIGHSNLFLLLLWLGTLRRGLLLRQLLLVVQGCQGCMPRWCDAPCHPRGVIWALIT
jgi:hypothetical protein